MAKFLRNYLLEVQEFVKGPFIPITLPFSIDFDIQRNDESSTNIAAINIYNLAHTTRTKIRKDFTDQSELRRVILKAGYGDNLAVIFDGSMTRAWSHREGTNQTTHIESFDNGNAVVNAKFNQQFPENTPQETIAAAMVASLKEFGVSTGAIGGSYSGFTSRGNAYGGNAVDLITQLSNGQFFIDNGTAHILANDEVIAGEPLIIDSASGLLNTPIREQFYFTFDMLFEPRLAIGQQIFLNSVTNPDSDFKGIMKVVGLQHKGMISYSVAGECITTVKAKVGTFREVPVQA